jgi:hypothetical protein
LKSEPFNTNDVRPAKDFRDHWLEKLVVLPVDYLPFMVLRWISISCTARGENLPPVAIEINVEGTERDFLIDPWNKNHTFPSSSNCYSSSMVWHGMVWYGMVWYGMVWYGTLCCGMVWYGMVWYQTSN